MSEEMPAHSPTISAESAIRPARHQQDHQKRRSRNRPPASWRRRSTQAESHCRQQIIPGHHDPLCVNPASDSLEPENIDGGHIMRGRIIM